MTISISLAPSATASLISSRRALPTSPISCESKLSVNDNIYLSCTISYSQSYLFKTGLTYLSNPISCESKLSVNDNIYLSCTISYSQSYLFKTGLTYLSNLCESCLLMTISMHHQLQPVLSLQDGPYLPLQSPVRASCLLMTISISLAPSATASLISSRRVLPTSPISCESKLSVNDNIYLSCTISYSQSYLFKTGLTYLSNLL